MDARIVKLAFLSPVHFGDGRLSGGRPTCDAATLFSALFIEALRMGCSEELIDAVKSGKLYFSDAFPYIGNDLYLPKPLLSFGLESEDAQGQQLKGDSRSKKAFKKLEYVRQDKLGSFLDGTMDPFQELEFYDLGASSLQMKVNLTYEGSDDSKPYGVGSYSFNNGAGIYFIVCGAYEIEPLLKQLKYSGIGGKRNSGYGRFDYSISDSFEAFASVCVSKDCSNSESTGYMLLSSSIPNETEFMDELLIGARTKVSKKGGFVQSAMHATTPQKKRDSFVFSPGSVFVHTFDGEVLDVNMKPDAHPVYRYAKAMWMEVR